MLDTISLQNSLPLKDFSQDIRAPRSIATCVIPPQREDGRFWVSELLNRSCQEQAVAIIVSIALLLNRQTRQQEITFLLLAPWDSFVRSMKISLDKTLQLSAIQADVRRLIESESNVLVSPEVMTEAWSGCLVILDLMDGYSVQSGLLESRADLCIWFKKNLAELSARIDYNAKLYRHSSIAPLARQLAHLMSEVATARADLFLRDITYFGQEERHRLIYGFNSSRVAFPKNVTMTSLIENRCDMSPDTICVIHNDQRMTFAELDSMSSKVAGLLVNLGISPGHFVAILDYRGIDFVVAMLAIWKAGAAYIPIDPSYPEDRVRYMLTDSEVSVAIAGVRAVSRFSKTLAQCGSLRNLVSISNQPDQAFLNGNIQSFGPNVLHSTASLPRGVRRAEPVDPAYMIYTSGSTGRPKGAIIRHDGAVNHLLAQADMLVERTVSRFLQSAPSSSDISVWQFVAPLAFGGVVVIVDDVTDVEQLHTLVQVNKLTIIELVPAIFKYFIDYASSLSSQDRRLPSLCWAMVTGESVSAELVNAWLSLYPEIPVLNAYGPTEAADDITQAIIRRPLPPNQINVSIGHPLANLDIYILDEDMRPLPVGAPGEICVAGIGVGNGYWKQPEKTYEVFVPNPFPKAAGATIYRTGDIGRWRDDGTLECFGRLDNQVQLRGFRIELQEIENTLRKHDGISDAVVQVFHNGKGDGQLVGFIVPQNESLKDTELQTYLGMSLPTHMIPSVFVTLDRLPLNPAGKIDRKALIAPPGQHPSHKRTHPYSAPKTPVEQTLANVWCSVLSVDQVSRDDNFFALGGDSLSAVAVAVAAREVGLHLKSTSVFARPTLAGLADIASPIPAQVFTEAKEKAHHTTPLLPIVQSFNIAERQTYLVAHPEYEDVMPLTPSQQGLFLHWLLSCDKTVYTDQYCWILKGELNLVNFEKAWNCLIERHAGLRTGFIRAAPRQPAQLVFKHVTLSIAFSDCSGFDRDIQEEAIQRIRQIELVQGFDLAKPPLMRVALVKLAPNLHYFVWTHHHIVLDGWSLSLALNEVLETHDSLAEGHDSELLPPITLAHYVDWLISQDAAPAEAYWRNQFVGWNDPVTSGRSPSICGIGYASVDSELDQSVLALLHLQCHEYKVTLTTLLEAAWALVLAATYGVDDVIFGIASTGRDPSVPGIDSMIGMFVTTLPLRVPISNIEQNGFHDWLTDIYQRATSIRDFEAIPLKLIMRWAGKAPGQTLFESLFVMSNYPGVNTKADARIHVTPDAYHTVPAFPLSVIIVPSQKLSIRINYDRSRFDAEQATQLINEFIAFIVCIAKGKDPRLLV